MDCRAGPRIRSLCDLQTLLDDKSADWGCQLLAPWQHGAELDDAVFRVAATFPIRPLRQHVYKIPGDSMDGFDPNAFVEKLIEETGISRTREPVLARHQGGLFYTKVRATSNNQARPNLEREAKQDAQELLWAVWSKCHPNLSRASGNHEIHVASVAWHLADFVIDNIHLAREFVSKMSGGGGRRVRETPQHHSAAEATLR